MGIAKVIGVIGGFILGGPIGGIVGYCLGKMLDGDGDQGVEKLFSSAGDKEKISFQMSLLTLMAAVMQANGETKRCELDYVKEYIRKAFTTEEDQRNALQMLKTMLEKPIDTDSVAQQVARQMNVYHKRELVHFLIGIGYADGDFDNKENATVKRIAILLGIGVVEYESIKATFTHSGGNSSSSYSSSSSSSYSGSSSYGGSNSYSGGSSSYGGYSNNSGYSGSKRSSASSSSSMDLSTAYTILGITAAASDEDVKKAYRSMAKKNHPDRVATLGEAVVKEAEKKFRRINEAYEYIKNSRGMS